MPPPWARALLPIQNCPQGKMHLSGQRRTKGLRTASELRSCEEPCCGKTIVDRDKGITNHSNHAAWLRTERQPYATRLCACCKQVSALTVKLAFLSSAVVRTDTIFGQHYTQRYAATFPGGCPAMSTTISGVCVAGAHGDRSHQSRRKGV